MRQQFCSLRCSIHHPQSKSHVVQQHLRPQMLPLFSHYPQSDPACIRGGHTGVYPSFGLLIKEFRVINHQISGGLFGRVVEKNKVSDGARTIRCSPESSNPTPYQIIKSN